MEKMTKCKTCNAEIAKNAKICPSCGAKNKKPIYLKWWFWAVAVFIIISITSNNTNKNSNSTQTASQNSNATTTTQKQDEKTFKIGDIVKVGDVEYTVLEVKDTKSIGTNQYIKKDTDNNFVVVKVTVKNTGDKSKTIDTNMFKLKDKDGATYSADATADMYVNEAGKGFFLQQANPNISNTGYIVFETPTKNIDTKFDLEVSGGIVSVKSEIIKLVK